MARRLSILFAAALNAVIAAPAFAIDGYYDAWPPPSGNGRLRLQPYAGVNLVTGMAIGADGHIVLAEINSDTRSDIFTNGVLCLVRLQADASYDYGFGPAQNGRVCLSDFSALPSELSITGTHPVAVQTDGKIVLAAQLYDDVATSHISALVMRLNVDGSLDTTAAGGTGFQIFQFSASDGAYLSAPYAVAVQNDGKIVVAGVACNDTAAPCNQDFAVARFDGALNFDASFGNGGRALINFDLGGNDADGAVAVRIDGANRIVLIGSAAQSDGSSGVAVARLDSNGALDATFGSQGRFSSSLGGHISFVTAGALDANGRALIVGVGRESVGRDEYAIARVLPDGSGLDTAFGGPANGYTNSVPGSALFGFAPAVGEGTTDSGSDAYDVAVQTDGRIVVVGQTVVADSTNSYGYFGVARLLPDSGAFDTSFGISGRTFGTFGTSAEAATGRAIVFAPGNRITVAGEGEDAPNASTSDVGIARLTEDLIYFDAFEPPNNASN